MFWRLRRMARRRRGHRPEEEVFERFSERFGTAPAPSEKEPRQESPEGPRRESARDAPPPVPVVPAPSALAVLGLGAGASQEEINAAYRRMARTYHPDKVANEPREVREESERRMKAINAAYSLLKRRGNGPAEGARVG